LNAQEKGADAERKWHRQGTTADNYRWIIVVGLLMETRKAGEVVNRFVSGSVAKEWDAPCNFAGESFVWERVAITQQYEKFIEK